MFQRVAYGVLAIVVLLLLVIQDVIIAREAVNIAGPFGELLRRGSLIPLFFVIMLLRASRELTRILFATGARPHTAFANVMIVVLLLVPWLSAAGWLGKGVAEQEGLIWQLTALMVTGLGAGLFAVLRRDPQGSIRDMGATLLLVFYLGFLGSFGLLLRCGRDIPAQEGAWLLLIVILITKASDIGAYFAGTAFGQHKLIPSISPGKTIEGSIGGLLGSAALASLIAAAPAWFAPVSPDQPWLLLVQDTTRSFAISHDASATGPVWRAFLLGLAVSAAGQIGDLVESCLKRDGGLKDSGNLIPTYGGVLDLIDSPIYAIPVAWFLLTAVWNVV